MKNLFSGIVASLLFTLLITSCKKDDTPSNAPALPHAAGNATVNAISLNGGSPVGRWTSYLYYDVNYRNDTFQTELTDTMVAGDEVINFFSSGVTTLWASNIFLDSGTYVISGNALILNFPFDTVNVTYGVSGNRMRWHSTTITNTPPNVMRTEEDIVFDRY